MYFIFDLHIGGFAEVRMTIPYQKVNAISCNSTGGEDDQKTQVAINENTLKLLFSLVGFSQATTGIEINPMQSLRGIYYKCRSSCSPPLQRFGDCERAKIALLLLNLNSFQSKCCARLRQPFCESRPVASFCPVVDMVGDSPSGFLHKVTSAQK